MSDKKKIFVLSNGECGAGTVAIALCEDGEFLAEHVSGMEHYVPENMGIGTDWKHDIYNKHCGVDGWELEYIKPENKETHEGLKRAVELNQKETKEGE